MFLCCTDVAGVQSCHDQIGRNATKWPAGVQVNKASKAGARGNGTGDRTVRGTRRFRHNSRVMRRRCRTLRSEQIITAAGSNINTHLMENRSRVQDGRVATDEAVLGFLFSFFSIIWLWICARKETFSSQTCSCS